MLTGWMKECRLGLPVKPQKKLKERIQQQKKKSLGACYGEFKGFSWVPWELG